MRKLVLPVALPAILLTALLGLAAPPGKWVEARSENFIVVSNAGEDAARKTAIQFEQIRSLFRDSLPYVKAHPSPVVTIFAVKDEDSLQGLLPEVWADKKHLHPAGVLVGGSDRFQIAIDINAQGDNPYQGIYHEYYHSVTVPYMPQLPLWIVEGMADFWGNSHIENKQADVGVPNELYIIKLRQSGLMPLAELFTVDHNSPYYNEQDRASLFYAESWALIHYLMMGDNGAHRAEFNVYLTALSQGATQDQAVAKAFGTVSKLQENLNAYVHGGNQYFAAHVPPPPKPAEGEIRLHALSPAEVSAYFGGFLILHDQFKEAEPLLNEAVELDPESELAQENLALLHFARKENAAAAASFSSAIALDSKNATTRYLRALVAYQSGARGNPQIEDDLRQAVALKPDSAEAVGLLAIVLSEQDSPNLAEALSLAQKAISLEPGNFGFKLAMAQILARMGNFNDAEVLGRRLQAAAPDKDARDQANQTLVYIGQLRANKLVVHQSAAAQASSPTPQTLPDSVPEGSLPVLKSRFPSAEGRVTQVSCNRDEMQLTLAPNDGSAPLSFQVKDVTHINYISDVSGLRGDFTPCTDLKGHGVKVTYTPPIAKSFQGELNAIEITK